MANLPVRIEYDSMGPVEIPGSALYGPQTQRAVENFRISSVPMPWVFIQAALYIKKAAAATNLELELLDRSIAEAIMAAADQLLVGTFIDQFPVPVMQTGSGTSSNMNVNEVIVGLAGRAGIVLSANDHANLGQSSNDVIPSALHIAAVLQLKMNLVPAFTGLISIIRKHADENEDVIKTGRTHLMDALPIHISKEFEAWAVQLDECLERFASLLPRLSRLPLGGTAVGSGLNCHPEFAEKAIARISAATKHQFSRAISAYKGLSSLDTVVELSGHLRTAAIVLSKIANDLRWMNSGPLAGLAEISLPALQPGSSIMPAKVNPVIPEAVCMAAAQVIGLDTAVALAGQAGTFQLNTMIPLAAANILESIDLLSRSAVSLGEQAIAGMRINTEICAAVLAKNPILVTALTREIGYMKAAELAHLASSQNRTILEIAEEYTDLPREKLRELLDPRRMADGDQP
jgi:fumarate hydratase, class II